MRDDSMNFAREEIADLASGYGMTIAFEAIGLGGAATVIEALTTLAELIEADDKRGKLQKESAHMLVEDMLGHLTASH